ncbi:hypothetical protein [Thalassoroseus pseudoceratinae]|uniref:hypothetical protein n=1 Tax=Thalassoroseus pseudoceratinae TaxID=2713176 RepID=UPI001F0F80C4|nr:hypothetical protein [Thalassoroseus pseudoceratinae]
MDRIVFDVLSRWLHVFFAIVLLGGGIFIRFVLQPAASELPEDQHAALHSRVMARWKRLVMITIGLLLLSGFYNYIVVMIPKHKGDGLYHGLMGGKMILAFVVFFLVSALTGKSAGLQKIRDNSRLWTTVTVVLGTIIVLIAGFLKIRG